MAEFQKVLKRRRCDSGTYGTVRLLCPTYKDIIFIISCLELSLSQPPLCLGLSPLRSQPHLLKILRITNISSKLQVEPTYLLIMPGSSRRDNNSGSTSTGTSSTTPSKYYMNKLWTCCKCNDNAAMDFAATEYCAGFHCGHHRCKRCPIEFHKRLIKEPDFRLRVFGVRKWRCGFHLAWAPGI
ncbi:hypothetical protein DL95DRAFT_446259 [Leptodontidium sp. 2 PMI_412]|nr:hypothetical protein DL95DRAFT_446259 [Leptodontidium sp. 2 PMI_412]